MATTPIPITPGTGGASVASDLVGGASYQQIKVVDGTIGSSTAWIVNADGTANVRISGSVATAGSSFTGSVSGTVNIGTGGPVSVIGTMSVIGTVPVTQSTTPWIITGSVQGSFTASANQSVSGTVGASIIGQLPAGTAVLGSVAALQGTQPWIVTSSIAGGLFPISGSVAATIVGTPNVNAAGSVVAFQGTSPWIVNFQNSSILAVPVGSTIAVLQSSSILAVPVGSVITVFQAPSIVGTYAEDAASASGDKGFLVMGARNDTLASVTSNDGDYSSHVVGPAGELIAANAPFTKWIQGTADFRQGNVGASILVIANGTASIFQYITGVQIANMGSASVLVTLASGGSTLGYSIAPAGGGSNIYYQNALKTPGSFGLAASISGIASVLLSAQGFLSKS